MTWRKDNDLQINQSRYNEGNLNEILIIRGTPENEVYLLVTWHDNGQVRISRRIIGKGYDIDSKEGLLYDETGIPESTCGNCRDAGRY
ncbi:hypothetical protein LCGC14_1562200 [marine sediment metagenome]|uniref:Uncharacterized protein n=1 Tax=marine sediment metagenome TaxID=412755 RepID=A0A0F9IM33_9ZZZZ